MPTQQSGTDPFIPVQGREAAAEGLAAPVRAPPEDPRIGAPSAGSRKSKAAAAKAKIADLADKATDGVDRASAAVSQLNSRAASAYDRAYAGARRVQERIDPLVHERPYAAIGVAACAGVFLGLLLGRGPRVIYLRPGD